MLLSGNAYAFEIIGKSTVKNVEKCIKNSSKLLDKELTKDRCITKYQKKITKDITSGKAYIKQHSDGDLILYYNLENISEDIVITGYEISFKHIVGYDGYSGYIYKSEIYNADKKVAKTNFHEWFEPGSVSQDYVFYLSTTGKGYFNTSKLNGPRSEFKLSIDNLKNGTWGWSINKLYGLYIR